MDVMINPTGVNLGPNPQDPNSPLYDFVDTQPASPYPNNPDSSLSHFTDRQFTPEGITATLPIVVTKTAHGLLNGMSIRSSQFVTMPSANATGMVQLNNRQFYVQQCTANTFQLYDSSGYPVDGRGFTAYISGGQFTVNGPEILCVNPSHFPPPGIVIPAF
jgi:hypothetical protein